MDKIKKNHRPLILVTNDDGVEAKGIKALIEAVRPFGDIIAVAPDSAMSGMSHAITVSKPLYLTLVSSEEGLVVYKANGTPADCVKLALNELIEGRPDYVVSGINHGTNSSVSMHYSGTVAGAREGVFSGIPSIAFSLLDHDANADFSTAVQYARHLMRVVVENGMEAGVCYNVNIPAGSDVKGIKVCRQAKGIWTKEFDKRIDPRGRPYFWMTGRFESQESGVENTDEWALSRGYVSVVPFTIDATYQPAIEALQLHGVEEITESQLTQL